MSARGAAVSAPGWGAGLSLQSDTFFKKSWQREDRAQSKDEDGSCRDVLWYGRKKLCTLLVLLPKLKCCIDTSVVSHSDTFSPLRSLKKVPVVQMNLGVLKLSTPCRSS